MAGLLLEEQPGSLEAQDTSTEDDHSWSEVRLWRRVCTVEAAVALLLLAMLGVCVASGAGWTARALGGAGALHRPVRQARQPERAIPVEDFDVTPPALGGCALHVAMACAENGVVDADCCAPPGTASCAEGYIFEAAESCSGAVATCCRRVPPGSCGENACQGASCVKPALVLLAAETDLCQAALTLKSLTLHDSDGILGDVYLAWVTRWDPDTLRKDISGLDKEVSKTRGFHFVDFSPQMREVGLDARFMQMVVRLKMAAVVKSAYYIILEPKTVFLSDVGPYTFFRDGDGAARVVGDTLQHIREPRRSWYHAAAGTLGLPLSKKALYPLSSSPAVMHTSTVLELLDHIGEKVGGGTLCEGPLCILFASQMATEFSMYYLFAYSKDDLECIHYPQHSDEAQRPLAIALLRAEPPQRNLERCMAALDSGPLLFEMQRGVLEDAAGQPGADVRDCVLEVYSRAGLFNSSEEGEHRLLDCAA